ncbi:putative TetR family transcriptional regulator [Sphingobium sp. SYK-6]|uniref:TetR/AcrR family transcriptional regulator n=1 Tax=Sphingobium sp. (strain NBRC 103272 / SYK-6) TaxID=627192 RepID=UPI000227766A|nr:TetR/AcrR family transcriptional regulator [Sphingobium sp. SYK-6]BAK66718.1 putative TetR family transcriptional regulator [Sphingobium sp. SYK-6]
MTTVPTPVPPSSGKEPRTERGRRTLRKLLDSAAAEFGEKGFHDASITGITSRAGTALGTFYTYFDSKDEVFRALVNDMSDRVRMVAREALAGEMTALTTERAALAAFLGFARDHKEIYRIVDEAEFVDPASYRRHYETTAQRIGERLRKGGESGEFREGLGEAHAWAIMGMNVFLGLRYCIWSEDASIEEITEAAASILQKGITRQPG